MTELLGSTAMAVPTTAPTKHQKMFCAVSATAKPRPTSSRIWTWSSPVKSIGTLAARRQEVMNVSPTLPRRA